MPFPCRRRRSAGPSWRRPSIEIRDLKDLEREVFGPVLHVLRYRRDRLDALIDSINASGYGLTFGLHTRIDETIARVTERAQAGNIYVNRNIIGAVVGVQPFGGNGLSGTGPKAGGPLYLRRLLRTAGDGAVPREAWSPERPAAAFAAWLRAQGHVAAAERAERTIARSLLGGTVEMPGPVGESNLYSFRPRGTVVVMPETALGLFTGLAAVLATGNRAAVAAPSVLQDLWKASRRRWRSGSPRRRRNGRLRDRSRCSSKATATGSRGSTAPWRTCRAAWFRSTASRPKGWRRDARQFPLEWLVEEQTVSTNTAAAGGNASLMAIG